MGYSYSGLNVPFSTLQVILQTVFPTSHLTGAKKPAFPTIRFADTGNQI